MCGVGVQALCSGVLCDIKSCVRNHHFRAWKTSPLRGLAILCLKVKTKVHLPFTIPSRVTARPRVTPPGARRCGQRSGASKSYQNQAPGFVIIIKLCITIGNRSFGRNRNWNCGQLFCHYSSHWGSDENPSCLATSHRTYLKTGAQISSTSVKFCVLGSRKVVTVRLARYARSQGLASQIYSDRN